MLSEIINVKTQEDLDSLSVKLLDESVFRELQEEMASEDVSFSRKDYWPADRLARWTSTPAAIRSTLSAVAKEHESRRALHILQMVMVMAPGTTAGIRRFLKRVTFA